MGEEGLSCRTAEGRGQPFRGEHVDLALFGHAMCCEPRHPAGIREDAGCEVVLDVDLVAVGHVRGHPARGPHDDKAQSQEEPLAVKGMRLRRKMVSGRARGRLGAFGAQIR